MSSLRALPPVDARVLVIDDDRDLLDALCEVLRDAGYEVSSAGNGYEALRVLADRPLPDLILIDLMMPIMDGYGFRQAQLADMRLAAIPSIALSAGPFDGRIQQMQLSGWMAKPVSVSALITAVERHRLRRPLEAPATPVSPSGHSMQFYDSDHQLAVGVAGFLAPALRGGHGALVVATADHWERFEASLAQAGVDPGPARARGDLQVLDARATLDSFLVGGRVIESRFAARVGPVIAGSERAGRRARIYGEMVDLLWHEGQIAAAVALEQCWNRLLGTVSCDLHCAYAMPSSDLQRASVSWIRQQHAA
jgi:CheY-like chemotaxis protein